MYRLTSGERVLLHLGEYMRFAEDFDVPYALSQDGIAEATGMLRNNVSRTLASLIPAGMVSERLAHVQGLRRRRKVYALTAEGVRRVEELRSRLMEERVRFLREDGSAVESTVREVCGTTGSRLGRVMRCLWETGEVRAEDLVERPSPAPGAKFIRICEDMPKCERFVSREREISDILNALDAVQAVVVYGIAGIGKSTLISRATESVPGHLFWRAVRPWDTPRSILADMGTFFSRLGARNLKRLLGRSRVDWGEVLSAVVNDTVRLEEHVLMVFDDVERAWSAEMRTMYTMLLDAARRSRFRFIIASRKRLDFYDVRQTFSSVREITLDRLDEAAARQILSNIPEDARAGIYQETKGHPLYLELINVRGVHRGARDLRSFIEEEIFSSLNDDEVRLVNTLCVHRIPVPADAVLQEERDEERLRSLVNRCLITEVEGRAYELHGLIRTVALDRMPKVSKVKMHVCAAEFYASRVGGEDTSPEDLVEHAYHLVGSGEPARAVRALYPYARELIEMGYTDVADLMEKVSRSELSDGERAFVSLMLAYGYLEKGENERALSSYEQALKYAQGSWKEEDIALLMGGMAETLSALRKYKESISMHRRSLRRFERRGDARGSARAHILLGRTLREKGDIKGSIREYRSAIATLQRTKDRSGLCVAWHNLALSLEDARDEKKAVRAFRKALACAGDDAAHAATVHLSFGEFHERAGRAGEAEREYKEARRCALRSGGMDLVDAEMRLGEVYLSRGENERAVGQFMSALERLDIAKGVGGTEIRLLDGLARAALGSRDPSIAVKQIERALSHAGQEREGLEMLHLLLGELYEASGRPEDALDTLTKGEKYAREPGAKIAYALRKGNILLVLGRTDDALATLKGCLELAERDQAMLAVGVAHELISEVMLRRGERGEAREELRRSASAYRSAGERDRVDKVERELERLEREDVHARRGE